MQFKESAGLEWQTSSIEVRRVLDAFNRAFDAVPGVIEAWARIDNGRVRFMLLITPDEQMERAAYEAELRVMDEVGADSVAFDVFRDRDSLKNHLTPSEQVLIAH